MMVSKELALALRTDSEAEVEVATVPASVHSAVVQVTVVPALVRSAVPLEMEDTLRPTGSEAEVVATAVPASVPAVEAQETEDLLRPTGSVIAEAVRLGHQRRREVQDLADLVVVKGRV